MHKEAERKRKEVERKEAEERKYIQNRVQSEQTNVKHGSCCRPLESTQKALNSVQTKCLMVPTRNPQGTDVSPLIDW